MKTTIFVMNEDDFLKNFALQFEEIDESALTSNSKFKDLDEWSSLIGLSVLNMVEKKYGVILTFDELRRSNSIQELFDIVQSKI